MSEWRLGGWCELTFGRSGYGDPHGSLGHHVLLGRHGVHDSRPTNCCDLLSPDPDDDPHEDHRRAAWNGLRHHLELDLATLVDRGRSQLPLAPHPVRLRRTIFATANLSSTTTPSFTIAGRTRATGWTVGSVALRRTRERLLDRSSWRLRFRVRILLRIVAYDGSQAMILIPKKTNRSSQRRGGLHTQHVKDVLSADESANKRPSPSRSDSSIG